MGHYALLLGGIVVLSSSVIFIKLSETDPVILAGYRVFFASLVIAPLGWRAVRRHRAELTHIRWSRILLPSLAASLHFISWNVAVRMTPATNSTLIVNMVPLVMPFLMLALVGERINRREVAGTLFALTGLAVLGVADYHFNIEYLRGDLLSFVSMLLYAIYLASARRNRDFPSIWLYLTPLYFLTGVICLSIAALTGAGPWIGPDPGREVIWIAAIVLLPTVTGHTILNISLKHLRGQTVTVINLTQFLFAGIFAYFVFGEIPTWGFVVASLLILGGTVTVILHREPGQASTAGRPAREPDEPAPQVEK